MSDQTESAWEIYRRDRSEAALRAMMEAHAGQVYAVALRRCGGRVDWAREATQAAFRELAGKAGSLPEGTAPGGWLHRCALFKSSEILRSETRRRKYERAAAADPGLTATMTEPTTAFAAGETGEQEPVWAELAAAVEELPGADRQVLRLRFYECLSLRQAGQALGISEDTAQKRVSRALLRLRRDLVRRGVSGAAAAATATVLGTAGGSTTAAAATGSAAAAAAPQGLASLLLAAIPPAGASGAAAGGAVAGGAVAGGMGAGAGWFQILTVMMTAKTKLTLGVVGISALLAVPFCWQQQRIRQQRETIGELSHRLSLAAAGIRPASPDGAASAGRSGGLHSTAGSGGETPEEVAAGGVAALEKILRQPDPLHRMSAFTAFLRGMTAEQAPAMFDLMLKLGKSGIPLNQEGPMFLHAWGALNGPAALDYTLKNHEGGTEDKATIMAGWSSRDPQAAMAWLELRTSGPWADQKEILAAGIANGLSQQDPEAAGRWIESRPASDAQLGMTEVLIGRLVALRGPQGAAEWFEKSGPQEANAGMRRRAFDEIADVLTRSGDIPQAVSWLERHAEESCATTGHAACTVLKKWAETDGAAAADWAVAHPGVGSRSEGRPPLGETVAAWAEKDPNAAGQWLRGKTALPGYDAAAVAFSSAIIEDDPESAFAWADTIQDPRLRADRRFNIGIGWIAQTPAEKQEALRAVLKAQGVDIEATFGTVRKP